MQIKTYAECIADATANTSRIIITLPEADRLDTISGLIPYFMGCDKKIGIIAHSQNHFFRILKYFSRHRSGREQLSIIDGNPNSEFFHYHRPIHLCTLDNFRRSSHDIYFDYLIFDDFLEMNINQVAGRLFHYDQNYPNFKSLLLSSNQPHLIPGEFDLDNIPVILYEDHMNYNRGQLRPEEREKLKEKEPNFFEYWDHRDYYGSYFLAIFAYIKDLHQHRINLHHDPTWSVHPIANAFIKAGIVPDDDLYFLIYQVGFGPYPERTELLTIADVEAMARDKNNPQILGRLRVKIAEARDRYPHYYQKQLSEIDKEKSGLDN